MPLTVLCPVKGDEINGDDCIVVCDVADGMIKPTVLPEGIEWNEEQRKKCRQCKYHADITPGKPRVVGVEAPAMGGCFIMERNIVSKKVFCPLLNKEVEEGYCWELCNIANDDILLEGDTVKDWDNAQKICRDCGRYE